MIILDLTKLLRSCYFALTTVSTVGYGDYLPKNTSEFALIVIIMIVGTVQFSYIMGSFNSALTDYHQLSSEDDNLSGLNTWLDSLEILHGKIQKPKLKQAILEHFIYYFSQDRLRQMGKCYWQEPVEDLVKTNVPYLEDLPHNVVDNILDYLFQDVFYDFRNFLDTAESRFKYNICFHFQPRKFEPGETILKEGEQVQEVILVLDGKVAAGPMDGKVHKVIMRYNQGKAVIGVYPALTENPALTTYKARGQNRANCYAIPVRPFIDILDHFYPDLKLKMLGNASKA